MLRYLDKCLNIILMCKLFWKNFDEKEAVSKVKMIKSNLTSCKITSYYLPLIGYADLTIP